MAVGTDTSAPVSWRMDLEWLYPNQGWVVKSTMEGTISAESTRYAFPSRKYRPVPLSNTGGAISRYKRNLSELTAYVGPNVRYRGPAYYAAQGKQSVVKKYSDGSGLASQALKRLNSRDLNLGVILVEGRETYGLLADAAIAVSTAYKQIKARNAKGALKTLGQSISGKHGKRIDRNTIENGAANSWLQIQFGWLPLLNDVYTAVGQSYESLAKGKVIKGSARRGSKLGSNTFDVDYVPSSSVSWAGTVSSPKLAWLQSFGLLNPLTLAWEGTRLSYLVDWLFQINTFLNSLTATAGLSGTRACSTSEFIAMSLKGSTVTTTQQEIKRTVGASPTLGNPLNFDMGGWHVATALAQAKQVFRNPR